MALYEFYGTECPHCANMMPIVDKLIEEGVKIQKLEVWHNQENATKLADFDRGLCGGVPFFFNSDSKQFICGEADEATVRAWARGDEV